MAAVLPSTTPSGTADAAPRAPRRREASRLLPAAFAALTLALGSVGLGVPSYWFDEAASLSAAERPPAEIIDLVSSVDAVHAVYYLILGAWVDVFGTSEVATRSLSLIALAAASCGFALFVLRWRGPRIAAVAGIAFVLLPGIAWSGGEARGYSMALACSVWALVALQRAARRRPVARRGGAGWWVLYALLLTASFAFSILGVLVVFAHVAYLLLEHGRRRLLPFAISWVVAFAAIAPLLLLAASQRGQVGWIDLTPVQLAAKVTLGQLFLGPREAGAGAAALTSAVVAFVVVAALAVLAMFRARGDARNSTVVGATLLLAPTVLLGGGVLVGVQLYQERYLLFAAPGACLLISEGIAVLRSRPALAYGVLGLLLVVMVAPLVAQRQEASKSGDDYRALAEAGADADAVVYASDTARGIGIAYPGALADARDLTLAESPVESDTLWGIDGAALDIRGAGSIAVYSRTSGASTAATRELGAAGCAPSGKSLRETRYELTLWSCPGP